MIKTVVDWFTDKANKDNDTTSHAVELATAVLMYEIVRADHLCSETEKTVFQQRLLRHFPLAKEELLELEALTEKHVGEASDLVQFTRVINQQCSSQQKRAILDSLWVIAFSDGILDPHEEHLIRRIADLLYLPHSQFIQSKLAAQSSATPN